MSCSTIHCILVTSNNIEDFDQVFFLSMCPKLRLLTLEGNPVCSSSIPVKNQVRKDTCLAFVCNLLLVCMVTCLSGYFSSSGVSLQHDMNIVKT